MLDKITEALSKNHKHVVGVSRIKSTEALPKLMSNGIALTGSPIYVNESVEASGPEARNRLCEKMAKSVQDWVNRRAKDINTDAAKIYVHVAYSDFFTDTFVKGSYEKHSAELKFQLYVSHAPIQA